MRGSQVNIVMRVYERLCLFTCVCVKRGRRRRGKGEEEGKGRGGGEGERERRRGRGEEEGKGREGEGGGIWRCLYEILQVFVYGAMHVCLTMKAFIHMCVHLNVYMHVYILYMCMYVQFSVLCFSNLVDLSLHIVQYRKYVYIFCCFNVNDSLIISSN